MKYNTELIVQLFLLVFGFVFLLSSSLQNKRLIKAGVPKRAINRFNSGISVHLLMQIVLSGYLLVNNFYFAHKSTNLYAVKLIPDSLFKWFLLKFAFIWLIISELMIHYRIPELNEIGQAESELQRKVKLIMLVKTIGFVFLFGALLPPNLWLLAVIILILNLLVYLII